MSGLQQRFLSSLSCWGNDKLKAELRTLRLSQSGGKEQMVRRLQAYYTQYDPDLQQHDSDSDAAPNDESTTPDDTHVSSESQPSQPELSSPQGNGDNSETLITTTTASVVIDGEHDCQHQPPPTVPPPQHQQLPLMPQQQQLPMVSQQQLPLMSRQQLPLMSQQQQLPLMSQQQQLPLMSQQQLPMMTQQQQSMMTQQQQPTMTQQQQPLTMSYSTALNSATTSNQQIQTSLPHVSNITTPVSNVVQLQNLGLGTQPPITATVQQTLPTNQVCFSQGDNLNHIPGSILQSMHSTLRSNPISYHPSYVSHATHQPAIAPSVYYHGSYDAFGRAITRPSMPLSYHHTQSYTGGTPPTQPGIYSHVNHHSMSGPNSIHPSVYGVYGSSAQAGFATSSSGNYPPSTNMAANPGPQHSMLSGNPSQPISTHNHPPSVYQPQQSAHFGGITHIGGIVHTPSVSVHSPIIHTPTTNQNGVTVHPSSVSGNGLLIHAPTLGHTGVTIQTPTSRGHVPNIQSTSPNPNGGIVNTPTVGAHGHAIHAPTPNLASTHIDSGTANPQSRLESLKTELLILETQQKIKQTQFNLSRDPEELYQSTMYHSAIQDVNNSTMLQLVKQSVDIQALPPTKPTKFTGDIIEYPKWKSLFDMLVETKDLTPQQKLLYLEEYLTGEPLDIVKGYSALNTTQAYFDARKELDETYGDPTDLTDAFSERLEIWSQISSNDKRGLKKYSNFLNLCVTSMASIPELSKLSDIRNMKIYPNTLPDALQCKWSRLTGSKKYSKQGHLSFPDYAEFVKKETFLLSSSTTSKEAFNKAAKNSSVKKATSSPKPATVLNTNAAPSAPPYYKYSKEDFVTKKEHIICHHCKSFDSHNTSDCSKLCQLSRDDQQQFFTSEHLCFRCLRKGHAMSTCRVKLFCSKCKGEHATVLHDSKSTPTSESEPPGKDSTSSTEVNSLNTIAFAAVNLTTMILPVYISSNEHPEEEIMVYALLDSQSNTSFIDDNVAPLLNTASTATVLNISTMTTKNLLVKSRKYETLRVRGINSNQYIPIPTVFTQASVPGNRDHIPTPDTALQWHHLKHMANSLSPLQDCKISLLIGYNCPDASLPNSVVRGKPAQPYALETSLGWVIVGGFEDASNPVTLVHPITTHELASEDTIKSLQNDSSTETRRSMLPDDCLFTSKMQEPGTKTSVVHTSPFTFKCSTYFTSIKGYHLCLILLFCYYLVSNAFVCNRMLSTNFDHVLPRDSAAPLLNQNHNHSPTSGAYLQEPAPDFGLGDQPKKLHPLDWFDLDISSAYSPSYRCHAHIYTSLTADDELFLSDFGTISTRMQSYQHLHSVNHNVSLSRLKLYFTEEIDKKPEEFSAHPATAISLSLKIEQCSVVSHSRIPRPNHFIHGDVFLFVEGSTVVSSHSKCYAPTLALSAEVSLCYGPESEHLICTRMKIIDLQAHICRGHTTCNIFGSSEALLRLGHSQELERHIHKLIMLLLNTHSKTLRLGHSQELERHIHKLIMLIPNTHHCTL